MGNSESTQPRPGSDEELAQQKKDEAIETAAKAVGAVAGAILVGWGAYKIVQGSEEKSDDFHPDTDPHPVTISNFRGKGHPDTDPHPVTISNFRGKGYSHPDTDPHPATTSLVGWIPPKQKHFKLNTDGAVKQNPIRAAGGGLIRDHNGAWIIGFHRKFGQLSIEESELWALRDGLQTAFNLSLQPIEVEIDSQAAIQLLEVESAKYRRYNNVILDCRELLAQLGPAQICLIPREANKCADRLANLGMDGDLSLQLLSTPPSCLARQIADDCNGVAYTRK